jgi:hypothetical protein
MTLMIASDLDQTLIYSPAAVARGPDRESRVVEILDDRVISLLSTRTEQGLRELGRSAVVVPVTTRTRRQYERLDLPLRPRYAVVASGGGILVDGRPDLGWAASVAARLDGVSSPVAALQEVFAGYRDREWLLRVRDADDIFLVAAVDADLLSADELAHVSSACDGHGWRALHQGRKLYVLPHGLDKAAAVAEVAHRVGHETGSTTVVLAAGDTLLDWPMLCAAERAWVPAGSELDRLGMSAPHVTLTHEAGLAAGEQIVDAWLEVAAARTRS